MNVSGIADTSYMSFKVIWNCRKECMVDVDHDRIQL